MKNFLEQKPSVNKKKKSVLTFSAVAAVILAVSAGTGILIAVQNHTASPDASSVSSDEILQPSETAEETKIREDSSDNSIKEESTEPDHSKIAYLDAYDNITAAITEKGNLYMCGYNHYAQIGNGGHRDVSKPIRVLANVKKVIVSNYHVLALTNDGDVYAWGSNKNGQLGDGTTVSRLKSYKMTLE